MDSSGGVTSVRTRAVRKLLVSLATVRALRRFLFDVDPLDPATMLFVALVLAAATLAAAFFPARRAAVVDPVEALKRE